MLGIAALAFFLLCGTLVSCAAFRRHGLMTRLYLGLTIGVALMMWLPSLFAFLVGFTITAQVLALGASLLIGAGAQVAARFWQRDAGGRKPSEPPLSLVLWLVIPFLLFSAYLQYTHILRPVDGALHVGQSTYGDLCLHLGIATGLRGAAYPPEYTLLPGTLLGYPFLMDALSSTMLLLGTPLSWSFVVPGALMMGLVYWGFVLLAWELTHKKMAVAISFLLVFLNGGLGFLYTFDQLGADSSRIYEAIHGFYQTPTNMPDLNLRWSNVIADMMIPQRTLLAGWAMVIPALWQLSRAMKSGKKSDFVALGLWAGAMPMVHTHSFLALGLISLGALVGMLFKSGERAKQILLLFGLYGVIAVALAAPQLLTWTFPQTMAGGSLKFRFNWVNWKNGGLIDDYLWFWVKNVGLVFLLLVPAALSCDKRRKSLALGALFVFVAAELFQFQTNEYDNNKLFYVAFLLMMPLVGQYLTALYGRLKGIRGRAFLLGVFLLASTLSGGVTLAREAVSDYQLFSASEAKMAQTIDENAPPEAVFLTGTQHVNAVSALAGRKIVCGPGTYLYFHGIDFSQQEADVQRMYEYPAAYQGLFQKYGVSYVYISDWERGAYAVDEDYFAENCRLWAREGGVTVYRLDG